MSYTFNGRRLYSLLSLLLLAIISACAAEQGQDGQTVSVNLSLIIDTQQTRSQTSASKLAAFIPLWLSGAPVWAQSVSDIATIQVELFGSDLPVPRTATVPVSNPTSGQIIPVQITAPVGANRTISVAAINGLGQKIYSGSMSGVNLAAGAPVNVEIRLAPTVTVTVQKQGDGSGTVTSSPAGIDCGGTCSAQFDADTPVTLTAAAAVGSTFSGWSGGCSGTGPCTVSGTATVSALFNTAISTARLTVTKSGTGTGTVTSNPSGINCGDACSANFATGTTVTLTATATSGSTFAGWSGTCTGAGSCLVLMNGNSTVTATFNSTQNTTTLTVTKAGAGAGTVSSVPAGINNCATTCSASFPVGSIVTLSATPIGGSIFGGWSGGGCSGTGSCAVVMNANQAVTATFNTAPNLLTLKINKAGNGTGTVRSTPSGINCGATCEFSFARGTTVTLTATPNAGSRFDAWPGSHCDEMETCSIFMDQNYTITARFQRN